MKTNGILIHESDHVVTLTLPVKAGEAVTYIRKGILTQVEAIVYFFDAICYNYI